MTIDLADTRPTSRLTGKPISQDQLDHLEHARSIAVIARRERQLTKVEAKAAELRAFLGIRDRKEIAPQLEKELSRWGKVISDLEDKHRSKLTAMVEKHNEALHGIHAELTQLKRSLRIPSAPVSMVSSVPPR